MRMAISLNRAGPATALACEAVGLLALWLTPDVEKALFLAPLLVGLVAWLLGKRLGDRLLLLSVALLVVAGYATAAGSPTGTLLARVIIPAHALLWLARNETLYRNWRLGIALMELVLAAILAPEVYMFLLIFFFVLVSSLSLSFGFLERNFAKTDPGSLGRPLQPSFVGAVLALSCLIFLSSLLIFPLLPRSRWSDVGSGTSPGYSENVSLRQSILYWAQRDSRPVIWIFREAATAWEKVVPFYLLRGQVLDDFRLDVWRSTPRAVSDARFPSGEKVEIMRQPLPVDVLPVPYGAGRVKSGLELGPVRFDGGEWMAEGSRTRRVRYEVDVGVFQKGYLGPGPSGKDAPSLAVPARFTELRRLAGEVAAGARNDDDRIRAVRSFFGNGFGYELGSVEGAGSGQKHPLDTFLFERRLGHCELFASATALLFRSMGMPSRLVVGFRVRPPSRGDVLTVQSSDAHAWVEVWHKERGWVTVDTTPVLSDSSWIPDLFGDAYDLIGAYWARYILEYEFEFSFGWLRSFGGALSGFLVLSGLFLLWRRGRSARLNSREKLALICLELEDDLVHRAGLFPEAAFRDLPYARQWQERYIKLRFGRQEPTAQDLGQMRRMAKHVLSRAVPAPETAA